MFLDNRNARRLISTNPVVLITTTNEMGKPNAMTAAWCTPVSLKPSLIMVAIHEDRYTMENIEETGEEKGFVINVPSKDQLEGVYHVGTRSGKKEEGNIRKAGFGIKSSEKLDVPKIENCPAYIECEVEDKVKEGDHYLVIGKPVSAEVKDEYWEGKFLAHKAKVFHHLGGNEFLCNGEVLDVELDKKE